MSGILYICGTPIGNLSDITMRQLETLKMVDIILCEDTRHTIKLLSHFDIQKKLLSYHEHNEKFRGEEVINLLKSGKNIALVSDAGMPLISDPGESLVKLCYENGVGVTAVPGPSASITALVLSGLSSEKYSFIGFFPKNKKEQAELIERLKNDTYTTVFYEAPHRLLKTLKILAESFPSRMISTVKEMTKKYETVISCILSEIVEYYEENEPKGEFVVVLEGASKRELDKEKQESFSKISIEEHMEVFISKGLDKKEAMKLVAKERGVSKREIYNYLNRGENNE
ncbi:MAG: 16S rRNA (cytidine(1402)-2'-O)-methyltransferase [Defluviitaleaceae bacterium]|nr:16S rRNA (cytidine(1402)-2'-O)-methyltransferase [Defluviitaleaceae bacterium]